MAHYAKVVDGIVVDVIVAEEEFFNTFVDSSPGTWIQTSYNTIRNTHPNNTPLRKNYAGIGFIYRKDLDAFIPPQPFPSWTLDEDAGIWNPPIPAPTEGHAFWNEEAYQADTSDPKTAGWVQVTEDE
jgi:hypothetical protein